ncbi:MAG TPA: Gar1/Naf1 family protein [Candidatus Thermoplasmatota archaeon]|nr:Gar1/Naf1 family protein [Candidatus Thermoplasmatota archaeon]
MARTVIGTVTQVSPRGELVVKTGGPLDGIGPGTRLVDARMDRVGRVVDVIGPVAKPYLVVAAEKPIRANRADAQGRVSAERGAAAKPRRASGADVREHVGGRPGLRLLGKELFRE